VFTACQHPPADYRYRPERKAIKLDWLDRLHMRLIGLVEQHPLRLKIRQRRFIQKVTEFSQNYHNIDDDKLVSHALDIGTKMRQVGFEDQLVARVFGIIREMSERTLGMRHFDCQIIGGWILLQGRVAEMKTGEGKTLTAVLPVISAAITGLPVHVITVNDYLAARDAEQMLPIYQRFGLSVGLITHESSPQDRRQAYQQDIVYVTGKELVFDYLRDRMKINQSHPLNMHVEFLKTTKIEKQLQLRGLHFALVDEVDSVLIDESRTPLIISGSQKNEEELEFLESGYELSYKLQDGIDYEVDLDRRTVELTQQGTETIRNLSAGLGPLWKGAIRREEVVHKALLARYIYRADHDYLVRDGKIELIDPLIGRVMEGRSWERGLHQMVELKEKCELTHKRTTLARISYQKFFRRYLFLAGMTGTAWEVRKELWNVYKLPVSQVPTHKPLIRKNLPPRVFATDKQRWQSVIQHCQECISNGRAVLIGTKSVADSEIGSEYLQHAGIVHRVLSARQDKHEADIVAEAGQPGRVTVATNMAGRGTDIKLHSAVEQAGGLHVILTEHYESARVDRQLAGRCARQGDPGSFEMLLSLENEPLRTLRTKSLVATAESMGIESMSGQKMALSALSIEQQFIERQNYFARQSTLEYDLKLNEMLAFSGTLE
jgi:preprotein translocase subunit SecA